MNVPEQTFDIVVVGGTPAGIMSAIAAARLGSSVALVEYHAHLGGMSTSGLGKSDIENKAAIAGLFREFTGNVHQFYIETYGRGSVNEQLSREGFYYEPSVAEMIFNKMIRAEKNITVFLGYQIEDTVTESGVIASAVFNNRAGYNLFHLQARVFIDATYEGDLFALAGAGYRLGRESKSEYNEPHAGKIFFDHNEHVVLPGSTGQGDDNLPAYTYRLCLTDDPENSFVMKEPPPGYHRENYTTYLIDLVEGRLGPPKVYKEGHGYYPAHFNTMLRVFSFAEIPNRKYDVNINPRPLGFPFPEMNGEYIEAEWEQREQIFQKHREWTLGLLYFVQNDPEVPAADRQMARKYHLPLDEFTDNQHFPWQLYVREGRRLTGRYTLTENDFKPINSAKRSSIFHDSVIAGEFPIDSFPVTREPDGDHKVLEGYICMLEIAPYQVPLRTLLSDKIHNLIVPVAASTSHVAFSTLRMEPMWMGLGQVAGMLAGITINNQAFPSEIPVHHLQKALLKNGQILTWIYDLDLNDKAFEAAQFWGTRGFFSTYYSNLHQPLSTGDLSQWMKIFEKAVEGKGLVPNRESSNASISILSFTRLIHRLGTKYGLWGAEIPPSIRPQFATNNWLYHERDPASPVMRGEVCLVLFRLFFLLKSNH